AGSLEGLLDLTLLNVGVGNGDAHAKNLSLLHEAAGTLRLAPAYDVLSTAFYPQADVRPGMYVHGQPSIHAITASDVVAEAVSWGLPPARTAARVEELLRRLPSAIAMAAREVPAAPEALVELVVCRASALAEGRAAGAAA
ncbi:MAG: HipA domain-containing protein, partial [Candidatus Sericytochromatia bacterium]|nr:HipA domain-containing protein [Candidatus Sericytochromatia bacterium]